MNNKHSFSTLAGELVVGVVLVGLVFFGEWLGFVQPLTNFISRLAGPISTRINQGVWQLTQPVGRLPASLRAARRLQELEHEYSQALAQIAQLEAKETENQFLKEMLEVVERPQAAVISAPISAHGQPSLAVGSNSGVEVGQPVVTAQTLLGVISHAQTHQSQVRLLSEIRTQPILAQTESGVKGLVKGDGRQLLLTELPTEVEIKPGEKIMTVGQAQVRSGIFIGQVQQLLDQPSSPTKTAVIEQLVSFYEVPLVEVWP